jgi:TrmH family RNA methyltransferase
VGELVTAGHRPVYLCHTTQWEVPSLDSGALSCPIDIVSEAELKSASLLQHPQQVLALFPLPQWDLPHVHAGAERLVLALDGVQDPGNLGTICRLADWFGIEDIICSAETADIFNPKAIQATMGAISRIRVHYTNLQDFLFQANRHSTPIYGTFLDGRNIYDRPLTPHGIIVMGNEGKGISREIETLVTDKLFIPSYPQDRPTTESLNVAVATAITCAEFRRRA